MCILQTNNLEWLETGNTWLDFVLYSIAPIVIHIAVPDALNFSLGTLAFGVVFSASIPLYRRWGGMAQQRLRANGVSLYYRVRNAYETSIRFEKEVCMCTTMPRAALRRGVPALHLAASEFNSSSFPGTYVHRSASITTHRLLSLSRMEIRGKSQTRAFPLETGLRGLKTTPVVVNCVCFWNNH